MLFFTRTGIAQIPLQCNDPQCNLVCFGDFEPFQSGFDVYYPSLGILAPVISGALNQTNTVDIYLDTDFNSKIVHFAQIFNVTGSPVNIEFIRVPLSEPIDPGCTMDVSFKIAAIGSSNLPDPIISIWALNAPPCQAINMPLCQNTVEQLCSNPTINAHRVFCFSFPTDQNVVQNNLDISGVDYISPVVTPYTNNTGSQITELLFIGQQTVAGTHIYRFLMDDIVVTNSCRPQLEATITPTVLEQCVDGQVVIAYEICLESDPVGPPVTIEIFPQIPQLPGVTVQAGGGFDEDGEAAVSISPDPGGLPVCTTLTLTLNVDASVPIGTILNVPMEVYSPEACLDVSQNNGNVSVTLEDCCQCEGHVTTYKLGTEPSSVTYLSQSGIPTDNDLIDVCIEVEGRLIWDVDLWVRASRFTMNEGAEIEISTAYFMGLDNTVLEGCDRMWRGITANTASQLRAVNNTVVRDAQYAIQALDKSYLHVEDCTFDQNYTGIYVPVSANGMPQAVYTYTLKNNVFIPKIKRFGKKFNFVSWNSSLQKMS
ncbi:MAG: right-handed parallel beta-helix repeat-containing protein [Saprospiraceae bacterium]|nr:right-handed parallel beta-helix repeat-containing protein [Saprospiraceae bacterium]